MKFALKVNWNLIIFKKSLKLNICSYAILPLDDANVSMQKKPLFAPFCK